MLVVIPSFKFAHEVYVLSSHRVTSDEHDKINFFAPLHNPHDLRIAIAYTLGVAALITFLIWLRTKRPVQKLGQLIDKASLFAPDLIRVVFGLSLILSAVHGAMFGPELPLSSFAGGHILRIILFVLGAGITVGLFTRLLSLISVLVYAYAFAAKGWYMLTYTNYLGEALSLILVASQTFSVDRLISKSKSAKARFIKPELALPAARSLFGFALLFTALNIKFFNPAVSLDVVNRYHLTKYFHYDPMLIVFGATLVEILIALLYISGLLLRVTTIAFVVFITLSLAYFKEEVWPHYMLFALAIGIFLDRPDKYSADRHLADKFDKPLGRKKPKARANQS